MTHPLVLQLRFARSEFLRGLEGVTDEEAKKRFMPMNCIAWNVGHLTWQEQRYWLFRAQNLMPRPEIQEEFRWSACATTPNLTEILKVWQGITAQCDPWLDQQTSDSLAKEHEFEVDGQKATLTFGTLMLRTTYHYWYHCGENQAIRQMLGHTGLPDFVGNIDDEAPYRPEK